MPGVLTSEDHKLALRKLANQVGNLVREWDLIDCRNMYGVLNQPGHTVLVPDIDDKAGTIPQQPMNGFWFHHLHTQSMRKLVNQVGNLVREWDLIDCRNMYGVLNQPGHTVLVPDIDDNASTIPQQSMNGFWFHHLHTLRAWDTGGALHCQIYRLRLLNTHTHITAVCNLCRLQHKVDV